jgi:hypothetical protein
MSQNGKVSVMSEQCFIDITSLCEKMVVSVELFYARAAAIDNEFYGE